MIILKLELNIKVKQAVTSMGVCIMNKLIYSFKQKINTHKHNGATHKCINITFQLRNTISSV